MAIELSCKMYLKCGMPRREKTKTLPQKDYKTVKTWEITHVKHVDDARIETKGNDQTTTFVQYKRCEYKNLGYFSWNMQTQNNPSKQILLNHVEPHWSILLVTWDWTPTSNGYPQSDDLPALWIFSR